MIMTTHKTGTRKEWLAARLELLKAEKELTWRCLRVYLVAARRICSARPHMRHR